MPRFVVAIADMSDGEISLEIIRAATAPAAVCEHPWVTGIYKELWVQDNLMAEDFSNLQSNFHNVLNWSVSCLNLDEVIMNGLNGGASSAS